MPDAAVASRGQMEVRIARKVAALTGVAGRPGASDDAGRGHRWFSDYRVLTTTELSLGGPVVSAAPADGIVDSGMFRRQGSGFTLADGTPDAGHAPIPGVTLHAYGPDTRAALVLTGVNRILAPVTDAIGEALAEIRRHIDDECLLVAVTHALLQEAFEAQPLLLLHGVQAGLIQRALRLSDLVHHRSVPGDDPVIVSRVEHGWPQAEGGRKQPDQLTLLSRTWDAVVAPDPPGDETRSRKEGGYLAFRSLDGFEQDHSFTIAGGANARDEWVSVLRDVCESHLVGSTPGLPRNVVWITRTGGDDTQACAVIARERQIELMLSRLTLRLVRWKEPEGRPRQVFLPALDVDRWRGADTMTKRAALLAHYYCIRGAGWLAGMKELDRRRDRPTCAMRFAELARGAEQLLDVADPLRLQLGVHGRGYVLQYEACRGRLDHAAYRRIVDDLDRLVHLTRLGRYSEPQLVEHLQIVLVELGTYRSATEWFAPPGDPVQPAVTADLRRLWRTARDLRDGLLTEGADRSYFDHDYAGFLVADPARGPDVAEGIRILDEEVLPARAGIARRERRSRGLRLSRQVFLRGVRTGLEAALGSEQDRCAWAARALEVADDLDADAETTELVDQRRSDQHDGFDNSVLILLLRIAEGRVAAVASGLVAERLPERIAQTSAAVLRVERYARGPGADSPGADPVDELRVRQVRELSDRWGAWLDSSRAS
jgi:hypothetical protein